MIKEIPMKEALQRYLRGEKIPCLLPPADDSSDWAGYEAAYLNDILNKVITFADVSEKPAKEKKKSEPKRLDWGRIWALKENNWSWDKIADEMGVSTGHLYTHKKDPEAVKAYEKYQETILTK